MLSQVGVPPPPDDFADFWTGLHQRARQVDPAPVARPSGHPESSRPGGSTYDVEFTSLGGIRLGGWLRLPADGRVERGLVVGHGYGGRATPDAAVPVERAAALYFGSRGLPTRGLVPGIPDTARRHVLHGIADRGTYVHGGCAADVWAAVSALCRLVPEAAARVDYLGTSFGGGIGALALPWDDRITSACLVVPSFGNHPLRLTMPCTGSGEAVREHARAHPEVHEVLRYFDAATAAMFLRIPTHVGLALADPAVPPPGQFAVYNALAGPRARFLLSAGHTPYAGMVREAEALSTAQRDFLAPLGPAPPA
ncbi:acetylxylan esterase [Plantactinospora sp. KLBMP9567]|uniref:acetylxylan esterase n=1 Tax=Plantactinospora sp. KLBMP9567 TaxID=3085900 RepID=UPI00298256F2|nr:acetylxylan esterase [Plantactinospora sp. KLBMP9567]MDW5323884.1 acetylxylan esterase [Plantactinospora sp. KLBMP9567]